MTDRAALLMDLADRVEKADGADRELDGAIWCAANGYTFLGWDGAGVMWRGPDGGRSHYPAEKVRRFTASLDNALSLVPEGWAREVYRAVLAIATGAPTDAGTGDSAPARE